MSAFQDYIDAVTTASDEHPTWRLGRAYFNVLADLHPAIAEEVRGGKVDPFNHDERLPSFVTWLQVTHPEIFP